VERAGESSRCSRRWTAAVVTVNHEVIDTAELLQSDPYEKGWLYGSSPTICIITCATCSAAWKPGCGWRRSSTSWRGPGSGPGLPRAADGGHM